MTTREAFYRHRINVALIKRFHGGEKVNASPRVRKMSQLEGVINEPGRQYVYHKVRGQSQCYHWKVAYVDRRESGMRR